MTTTGVIHSNVKGPAKGAVRLDTPEGWTVVPASAEFSLAKDGEDQTVAFEVHPARLEQKHYTLTAVAQYNGHEYKEGYRTVGYAGLRPFNLYRPATLGTTGVEVKVAPGLNVGYVMADDATIDDAIRLRFGPLGAMVKPGILAGSMPGLPIAGQSSHRSTIHCWSR